LPDTADERFDLGQRARPIMGGGGLSLIIVILLILVLLGRL
jgi:hypothetical protein